MRSRSLAMDSSAPVRPRPDIRLSALRRLAWLILLCVDKLALWAGVWYRTMLLAVFMGLAGILAVRATPAPPHYRQHFHGDTNAPQSAEASVSGPAFTAAQLRAMDGARGAHGAAAHAPFAERSSTMRKVDRAYGSELRRGQIRSMQSAEQRMSPAQLRVEASVARMMTKAQLRAMATGMRGMSRAKLQAMSREEAHMTVEQLAALLRPEHSLTPKQLRALGDQMSRMSLQGVQVEAAQKEGMSPSALTAFVKQEAAMSPAQLRSMGSRDVTQLEDKVMRANPNHGLVWRTAESRWMPLHVRHVDHTHTKYRTHTHSHTDSHGHGRSPGIGAAPPAAPSSHGTDDDGGETTTLDSITGGARKARATGSGVPPAPAATPRPGERGPKLAAAALGCALLLAMIYHLLGKFLSGGGDKGGSDGAVSGGRNVYGSSHGRGGGGGGSTSPVPRARPAMRHSSRGYGATSRGTETDSDDDVEMGRCFSPENAALLGSTGEGGRGTPPPPTTGGW